MWPLNPKPFRMRENEMKIELADVQPEAIGLWHCDSDSVCLQDFSRQPYTYAPRKI